MKPLATAAVQRASATLLAGIIALAGCGGLPASPSGSGPLRIAVLSDFNSAYGSTTYEPEVSAAVAIVTDEWRPDLVLIAGDMVAGQRPSLTDANVRAMWAAFDSVVAAPLRAAGIPFAFTIGNHDGSGHPGHERDRRLAQEHWTARGAMPPLAFVDSTSFPFQYAFTLGDVFFLVADASTGAVAADAAQLDWMRRMLTSDAARNARTRIALGHVPLYAVAVGRNRPGEVQAEPDSVRRILERGGVAMYVAGHHHAYYPGRRGGLLQFSTGALGQGPRPLVGSDAAPYKSLTLLTIDDSGIRERTFGIAGDSIWPVDPQSLPPRIHGINGYLERALLRR
ncbi:MAG: metallophosphoesterase family protein [Longimicrobiales bacterium]